MFFGKRGGLIKRCTACQRIYNNWNKKSPEERAAATRPRSKIKPDGPLLVSLVLESGNRKTGPIPVSMTSARTCPKSCAYYGAGCYAEQHILAIHWRRLSDGKGGLTWDEFCEAIRKLPEGQLWRHNEAGDLPGDDDEIDREALRKLVEANRGKRGFTYTHKPLTRRNAAAIRYALRNGFCVNISADSPADADAAMDAGLPAVLVLPEDVSTKGNRTPKGRPITVCPAVGREGVTCATCKLCAIPNRKSPVGFPAHGDRRSLITTKLRQLPLFELGPDRQDQIA